MSDRATVSLDSRIRRRDDVPWKVLDEVVVILDLESGDFFELDEVAAIIWKALDGTRTLEEHAQSLLDDYRIDIDTARSDVVAFVSDLDARGLVLSGD